MSPLRIRQDGAWVDTDRSGFVRLDGAWVPFGPDGGGEEYGPPESVFVAGVHDEAPLIYVNDGEGVNLGVTLSFAYPGIVTHGRFRFTDNPGTQRYNFQLYTVDDGDEVSPAGTMLITDPTGDGVDFLQPYSVDGWGTVAMPWGDVEVEPDRLYRARVWTEQGRYCAKGAIFNSVDVPSPNGLISAVAHLTEVPPDGSLGRVYNGSFRYANSMEYPIQTFNAANYYVDVVYRRRL